MNLKNDKGYIETDVSIAVLVLLILIPTIMGIVFSINRSQNSADIKAEALNIAVNTIETAKGISLENLDESGILTSLEQGLYNGKIDTTDTPAVITTDKAVYQLEIAITDYHDTDNTALENVVKTVTVTVTYKIGGQDPQSIDLSTVIK